MCKRPSSTIERWTGQGSAGGRSSGQSDDEKGGEDDIGCEVDHGGPPGWVAGLRRPDSGLVARRLAPIHARICATPACAARHGEPRSPNELRWLPCITDPYHRYHRYRDWRFASEDGTHYAVEANATFASNSLWAMYEAMMAGLGFCLLPEYLVRRNADAGTVVTFFDSRVADTGSIYAVFPTRTLRPRRVEAVLDHLAASLA